MSLLIAEIAQSCRVKNWAHVGSRSFLAEGFDDDYLFFSEDWRGTFSDLLLQKFEVGGSVPADEIDKEKITSDFLSLRRDDLNIILTDSQPFYDRFVAANDFCKVLNQRHGIFTTREERVELFQLALYGNSPIKEEVLP